jgi:hypothetical protein
MYRPTQKPVEFTTKLLEEHLKELQESVKDGDERVFDEVVPHLNVPAKRAIAKDLPKIEVKPHPGPAVVKRKPYPISKRPTGPSLVDIEYVFPFTPERLEAPLPDIPPNYGYDYMTEQLLDLTYQFTRLSVPDPISINDDDIY